MPPGRLWGRRGYFNEIVVWYTAGEVNYTCTYMWHVGYFKTRAPIEDLCKSEFSPGTFSVCPQPCQEGYTHSFDTQAVWAVVCSIVGSIHPWG